jgi:hypothetical protein
MGYSLKSLPAGSRTHASSPLFLSEAMEQYLVILKAAGSAPATAESHIQGVFLPEAAGGIVRHRRQAAAELASMAHRAGKRGLGARIGRSHAGSREGGHGSPTEPPAQSQV